MELVNFALDCYKRQILTESFFSSYREFPITNVVDIGYRRMNALPAADSPLPFTDSVPTLFFH
jgi:hypothetical protein